MVPKRVVLAPEASAADVSAALAGWRGGATDLVAGVGGEPISARWTRGDLEVRYSANPAIGLRVIEGSGVAEVAGRLPLLSAERAVVLARSSDPATALLGITASGMLGEISALPTLQRLVDSDDERIRGAAELAIRRVGMSTLVEGAERVQDRRRAHPDRDPVLGLLVPVALRRQVLRQILADPPADARRIRDIVAAGLGDDDWEVRWSAVLGAHDHRVPDMLMAIRECPLGTALHSHDRETLGVVRDVVGHRLAGTVSTHPGAPWIAALLDGTSTDHDTAFLLVTALREPVVDEPSNEDGFVVVDAVPHWLGGAGAPVRRARPDAPFAIAVEAETDVELAAIEAHVRALSATTGRVLRLPKSDELEMATRGTDARRYPWGNGHERHADRARSPWGLRSPLATAEWVTHADQVLAKPSARSGCGAEPRVALCRGTPARGVTRGRLRPALRTRAPAPRRDQPRHRARAYRRPAR